MSLPSASVSFFIKWKDWKYHLQHSFLLSLFLWSSTCIALFSNFSKYVCLLTISSYYFSIIKEVGEITLVLDGPLETKAFWFLAGVRLRRCRHEFGVFWEWGFEVFNEMETWKRPGRVWSLWIPRLLSGRWDNTASFLEVKRHAHLKQMLTDNNQPINWE